DAVVDASLGAEAPADRLVVDEVGQVDEQARVARERAVVEVVGDPPPQLLLALGLAHADVGPHGLADHVVKRHAAVRVSAATAITSRLPPSSSEVTRWRTSPRTSSGLSSIRLWSRPSPALPAASAASVSASGEPPLHPHSSAARASSFTPRSWRRRIASSSG